MKTLFPIAVILLSVSCTTAQFQSTQTAVAAALISDQQEEQLGLQVHQELVKENTKFLNSPQIEQYVSGLANKVLVPSKQDRDLRWNWYIIDDIKTVNAFATPGGRIYVYTGLLASAQNEAEVAGVLGHEVGHVVARHSARQLVAAMGIDTLSAVILGKNPNDLAKIAAALSGKVAMLAYGRSEEHEADEYGARYASSAGYDPTALATFFDTLKRTQGDTPKVLSWLSTHPQLDDRMSHIRNYAAQNKLNGRDLGADRLAAVKKYIR